MPERSKHPTFKDSGSKSHTLNMLFGSKGIEYWVLGPKAIPLIWYLGAKALNIGHLDPLGCKRFAAGLAEPASRGRRSHSAPRSPASQRSLCKAWEST